MVKKVFYKRTTRRDPTEPFSIPNRGPTPRIEKEEGLAERLDVIWADNYTETNDQWAKGLRWHDRLFAHATMNSARRNAKCKRPFEPKDELDFVMEAAYCPQKELFSEKTDPYLHIETVVGDKGQHKPKYRGNLDQFIVNLTARKPLKYTAPVQQEKESWRVLKNRLFILPKKNVPRSHPLVYSNGGTSRRENIYNVKLGIPADHSSHSNPGYSRTPSGAFYCI